MTQEQEKALKVVEKLISDMGCHVLSAEEIMILIQGIMSNDGGGCNWKYVQVPHYQPGLEPDRQPGYRPGEVWCQTMPNITYFKSEKEMIEEARKTLEKNGDPIISGDNPKIGLLSNESTTTLNELPKHFKGAHECLDELRKKLDAEGYADNHNPIQVDPKPIIKEDGIWKYSDTKQPTFCAGDNIPDMQYVIR